MYNIYLCFFLNFDFHILYLFKVTPCNNNETIFVIFLCIFGTNIFLISIKIDNAILFIFKVVDYMPIA